MSVNKLLSDMAGEIEARLDVSSKSSEVDWDDLKKICQIVSNTASQLKLNMDREIQYGRYLVAKTNTFNIQLDVFSKNYIGAPHNHETWGVMSAISGDLGISDYLLDGDDLQLIRQGILKSGSAIGFMKESDWHSTETFDGEQVASFHVYGCEFNLDKGSRFIQNAGVQNYQRGTLHTPADYSEILILEK